MLAIASIKVNIIMHLVTISYTGAYYNYIWLTTLQTTLAKYSVVKKISDMVAVLLST